MSDNTPAPTFMSVEDMRVLAENLAANGQLKINDKPVPFVAVVSGPLGTVRVARRTALEGK